MKNHFTVSSSGHGLKLCSRISPHLLGMLKNMLVPLKTSMKKGQHSKDGSLVVMELFAMSTTCLWSDTDTFTLRAGWTHLHCQPLSRQETVPACILIMPICLLPTSISPPHFLWLSSFSFIPSGAFVWLYFRHPTRRSVIVDAACTDLQCALALWTFAVLLLGMTRADRGHRSRE